jgi:hypothetical protein
MKSIGRERPVAPPSKGMIGEVTWRDIGDANVSDGGELLAIAKVEEDIVERLDLVEGVGVPVRFLVDLGEEEKYCNFLEGGIDTAKWWPLGS